MVQIMATIDYAKQYSGVIDEKFKRLGVQKMIMDQCLFGLSQTNSWTIPAIALMAV